MSNLLYRSNIADIIDTIIFLTFILLTHAAVHIQTFHALSNITNIGHTIICLTFIPLAHIARTIKYCKYRSRNNFLHIYSISTNKYCKYRSHNNFLHIILLQAGRHSQPSIFKYRSMWPMFVEPRECIRPQKKEKQYDNKKLKRKITTTTKQWLVCLLYMLYSNIAQCGLCLFSQTSALEPQKRNCGGFAGYCYSSAVRTITITTSSQSSVDATAKQYNC